MRHPDLELVPERKGADGLSAGYPPCERALRVWRRIVQKERAFSCAAATRRGGTGCSFQKMQHSQEMKKLPQEVQDFLQKLPEQLWKGRAFRQVDDQCLLLPEGVDCRTVCGICALDCCSAPAKGTVRAVSGACNGAFCAFPIRIRLIFGR
ncbi:MAG: hypothetical protein ACLTSZ_06725 [Lachnospiraceae bacterium]